MFALAIVDCNSSLSWDGGSGCIGYRRTLISSEQYWVKVSPIYGILDSNQPQGFQSDVCTHPVQHMSVLLVQRSQPN